MGKPADYCDVGINWFTGCEPGLPCWDRCWARGMASRLKGRSGYPADEPFRPTFHEEALQDGPHLPRKPSVIALNFMGDWALAPARDLTWMLDRIEDNPRHTFLTLTKRPALLREKVPGRHPSNLWVGTSIEDDTQLHRWAELAHFPGHVWLSLEPLLGPVNIPNGFLLGRSGHNWVVAGCESGHGARWGHRCEPDGWEVVRWTRSIVAQCHAANVPVWVKQLPVFKEGKWVVSSDMADFPADLRVQAKPKGA